MTPASPSGSCNSADTTAAIDQAVADGVDAINYSISGTLTAFTNSVEVSFLFAAAAGVYVSASAGNSGPADEHGRAPEPVDHHDGCGHAQPRRQGHGHDRRHHLQRRLVGRNGASGQMVVYGAPILGALPTEAGATPDQKMRLCFTGCVPPSPGKIVVCERGVNARIDKSLAVLNAGGAGMIMVNATPNSVNADLHFVPSIHLADTLFGTVEAAAQAGKTASISKGTIVYDADAPFTASFSSRGPITAGGGDILKPDIIAPGQDILAAVAPPGNHGRDFDLYSGTSMSSPHITAIGALMHQAHPDWSPMMIKSALMTTAYQGHDYDAFNWGAGHVDPNKATDPGLVFDSNLTDWLSFLKGQNLYTGPEPAIDASDLNSASIAIGDMAGAQTVKPHRDERRLEVRDVHVLDRGPAGIQATPSVTSFTAAPGSSTPWTVTFLNTGTPLLTYSKGFIVWTGDKGHKVRMAVAIRPVKFQAPAEASGTGTTGSLTYNARSGYAGNLQYVFRGLSAADATSRTLGTDPACNFNTATPDAMVAAGKANVSTFVTPANANYVRFQTFAADASASAHDLDMFIYRAAPAPAAETYALLATSGGPDANEFVGSTSTLLTTPGTQSQGVHPRLRRGRTGRELRAQLVGADVTREQPVHDVPGLPGRDRRPGDPDHVRLDGPAGGQPLPRARPDGRSAGSDGGDVDDAGVRQHPLDRRGTRTTRGAGRRRPLVVFRLLRPTRVGCKLALRGSPIPHSIRCAWGKREPLIRGGSRIPIQGRDIYAIPISGRATRARSIGPAGAGRVDGRSGRLCSPHT